MLCIFLHNVNKTFFNDNQLWRPLVSMHTLEKARHISKCLELAILLEVGAHKPGNVNAVTNFENTRYEHFLASAVAAASSFEHAAEKGIAVSKEENGISEVGVGRTIKECVADIDVWQHGGNTLLGAVILLSPMAVAAGMTPLQNGIFEIQQLRRNLKSVVESTTPADAVNVYEAIEIAKPSGLGAAPKLDVKDTSSRERILKEKVSLYDIFKIAEKYDSICSEWVNNYPITFDFAYPFLIEQLKKGKHSDVAIIHTFLKVLANYPDTFIARKVGIERAREVSTMAGKVLQLGGFETENGKEELRAFDSRLRQESNLLNPGTTADIVAAALAVCVLSGYRP
jgi:triphosphoribosyl-dephospho-CoA synthase